VVYVDDSKATNPHAAVASIAAYPSVVLIAGGRNKGLDLAPILEVATLRRVIAIGEAAGELSALAPGLVEEVAGLSEAVRRAADIAEAGDTVLLAPGCASFDQFRSYGHRGDVFAEAVRGLGGSEGSP
jgi:UDP-N-acetylmuramoylalanine--D-glutamate ligase